MDRRSSKEVGQGLLELLQILTVRLCSKPPGSTLCLPLLFGVCKACPYARVLMFHRLIFLVLLLHGYLAWRLLPPLPQGWMVGLLALWLLLSCVLLPAGLAHRRLADPAASDRLAWLGFGAMGVFSSLLALSLLRDLFLVLLAPWLPEAWWAWSAMAVPVLALLFTVLGLYAARRTPQVRQVRIPIRDLAPGLHGLKIAQISDLHVGPTIKRDFVQKLVLQVNALQADLVVLTGDLVDGSVEELRPHTAPLAELRSRLGSYAVTGNHEYYAGCRAWLAEYRRLGMRVLINEHHALRLGPEGGQATLVLAGVTDWSAHLFDVSHRSDPQKALAGAPAQVDLRVLLAHQPRSAAAAEQAGFDVQLSGHTHGGQVWPWSYLVYLQQPYRAGLRRRGRMWVYTSRGSGYWGPPKRLGAPSEVTLITLAAA